MIEWKKPSREVFSQLMRQTPAYETAAPELRGMMDDIIAETDMYDPDSMATFGQDAWSERREVANRIMQTETEDSFGFLREPLEEASSFIENFDLEGIQSKLGNLASGAVGVVKRNKLAAAGAAAALVFAGPMSMIGLAGLTAAGGLTAVKETTRKVKQNHGPETAEQLEERLREGIASFNPMVHKLETAREQIPAVLQDIRELGETNMLSLFKSTIYLAAGRELLHRIMDIEIPARDAEGADADVSLLEESAKTLSGRLPILEQTRTGSIMDVSKLANLSAGLRDTDQTIQSILTDEIDNHRASMAASSRAVDVLRFNRIVADFRKATEKGAADAIKATTLARDIAASNRIDSPERMQAQLANMQRVGIMLEKSLKALPSAQKAQEKLQRQLDTAVGQVVDAQERYARQASNGNTQSLTGPARNTRALRHEG